jgi:transcriptional regulator with XRE-family HTH domain
MTTDPLKGDFAKKLRQLIDKTTKTAYRISELSGVDRAYLSRLLSGKRTNPGRKTVLKLCLGLYSAGSVERYELDELLSEEGYGPLFGDEDADAD